MRFVVYIGRTVTPARSSASAATDLSACLTCSNDATREPRIALGIGESLRQHLRDPQPSRDLRKRRLLILDY